MGTGEEQPSPEVAALRSCRAEVDQIAKKVSKARAEQAALESRIQGLMAEQRQARARRRDAVVAADEAGVPRLRIAKEVGMPRGNVYKLFGSTSTDET